MHYNPKKSAATLKKSLLPFAAGAGCVDQNFLSWDERRKLVWGRDRWGDSYFLYNGKWIRWHGLFYLLPENRIML